MDAGNGLNLEIGNYKKKVETLLKQIDKKNFVQRLWDKDRSLFVKENDTTSDVLMGWLELPEKMLRVLPEINEFCKNVRNAGFDHVVLLGMGGSSLAPMVFQKTIGTSRSGLNLTVLDTTEPVTIKRIESSINIASTLFIVASKSGNTAEVMALYEYFYYRVSGLKKEKAGENFIAITDKGSPLVDLANRKKFRKIFINLPEIGGRYSALSYFGIVPAALMGINVKEILMRAKTLAASCGPNVPAVLNSEVILGVAMAEMASKGCEKLTYMMPGELDSFGLWLEQLIAESTGKEKKGIMPFNGYPLTKIGTYGKDRFFVKYGFSGGQNDLQTVEPTDMFALRYPVITISIKDQLDLGKEFFRWEIATAVAGAMLGINPFDQPNVQESKKCTDSILKQVAKEGGLPKMEPALIEDSLKYFYDKNAESGIQLLRDFLGSVKQGDYVGFQAYLPEQPEVEMYLAEIHKTIQANYKVAVSAQFGPRYLHSTGQYHKGGPNNGCFIQLVCSSSVDINIPEHPYTFGVLKRAQAIGDREALMKHGRKVITVDLGEDYLSGLNKLKQLITSLQTASIIVKKSVKKKDVTLVAESNADTVLLMQNQLNIENTAGQASASV
jgi:transaldolase / glucose-6-phosphate isomerase